MQLITERITYHSRSDQFHWYHLSDLHVGARACDEKLLRQHVRTILDDPAAIVTLGGDLVDAISRKGDKRRERGKQYHAAHPEQAKAKNVRRRARVQGAKGSFVAADIEAVRTAQGNRCYLCGKPLKRCYHVDHFIPLALGGTNDPGNLRLACPKCNLSKGAKHPHELGILL